jgi:hypothetical protein
MPDQDANYDYCNDEFPVLSFAYALYCDPHFAEVSHETWLRSLKGNVPAGAPLTASVLRKSGVYTAYLDDYTQDRKRVFPLGAIELITVTVATNPPVAPNYYAPTEAQAKVFFEKYLFRELTGASADEAGTDHETYGKRAKKQGKRENAEFNPKRPVLSCLALLLVNTPADAKFVADPAAFLKDKVFDEKLKKVLIDFVKSKEKHLTDNEANALKPELVAEFTREPYVW